MHDFFDFNLITTIITPNEEAEFPRMKDDCVNLPLYSARHRSADTFVISSRMAELLHSRFGFEIPIDHLIFIRSPEEQKGVLLYDMIKPCFGHYERMLSGKMRGSSA